MSALKPFDLKLAQAGHPIQTRNGRPATFITYCADCDNYQIVASINRRMETFIVNGGYHDDATTSGNDLFMAPVTRTMWTNVYNGSCNGLFETKEDADEMGGPRIACIQITFTEGEGL